MKPFLRQLALERIQTLFGCAMRNARENPSLSQRQAMLARRISTRHRIRLPYEIRIAFCKKCKSFIAPGVGSRIRLGRASVKSVRVSCSFCGHTYRKIIPAK